MRHHSTITTERLEYFIEGPEGEEPWFIEQVTTKQFDKGYKTVSHFRVGKILYFDVEIEYIDVPTFNEAVVLLLKIERSLNA